MKILVLVSIQIMDICNLLKWLYRCANRARSVEWVSKIDPLWPSRPGSCCVDPWIMLEVFGLGEYQASCYSTDEFVFMNPTMSSGIKRLWVSESPTASY